MVVSEAINTSIEGTDRREEEEGQDSMEGGEEVVREGEKEVVREGRSLCATVNSLGCRARMYV